MSGPERLRIGLLASLFSLGYALVGVFRHRHFSSNAFDLGIFDQVVWHLSRFETPASSLLGLPHLLGDHFHPILALFAPLYWVAPHPETLIVAQAVLLGTSMVPMYAFVRTRLGSGGALWVTAAYGSFWGMQRTAWFDVHELAFAPLVIAALLIAVERRRAAWIVALALIACLIKEDVIVLVATIGVWVAARGQRWLGLAISLSAVLSFVLITQLVIPAFRGGTEYHFVSAFQGVLDAPWRAPAIVLTPPETLQTLRLWIAPFLLLPVCSPLIWIAVPLMLTRLLSDVPGHWNARGHYSAPIAPLLAAAAADGLARVQRRWPSVTGARLTAVLVVMFVAAMVIPGHQPLLRAMNPKHYRAPAFLPTAREALARVPPNASVVAQSPIVPHLSHRDRIYMLDETFPDADVVITAAMLAPWPLGGADDVARQIDAWRARGYRTVFDRDGWIVLMR